MKKFLSLVFMTVLTAQICMFAVDSVRLSNVHWDKGSKCLWFTISYQGSAGDAWIGIVLVGTAHDEKIADMVDIQYAYLRDLKNNEKNSLSCRSLTPGKYEVQVYASDNGGKYLCGEIFDTETASSTSIPEEKVIPPSGSGPWAALSKVRWNNAMKGVEFTISYQETASDAWVGIVPKGTAHDEKIADMVDIKYVYLRDLQNGGLNLIQCPSLAEGEYELQVYASDSGGKYLDGVKFNTNNSTSNSNTKPQSSSTSTSNTNNSNSASPNSNATASNPPTTSGPWAGLSNVRWNNAMKGVEFTITYKGTANDAWVGIVPKGTAHDEKIADMVDIKYVYLRDLKNGGANLIQCPSLAEDEYELQVYASDNGGKYLDGVRFDTNNTSSKSSTTSGSNTSTTTSPSSSGPSATLSQVHWNSAMKGIEFTISYKETAADAWVGIVPVGTAHQEKIADMVDIKYVYLRDLKNNGTNLIQCPSLVPGEYELHVYASDRDGKYLDGVKFSVR